MVPGDVTCERRARMQDPPPARRLHPRSGVARSTASDRRPIAWLEGGRPTGRTPSLIAGGEARAHRLLLFAAILLHKAPEGFAITSVVLAARGTRRQAILAAGAVGLATLVGGLAILGERTLVGPALAVSAGVTLYVAASDLVPEVNREEGTAVALTVFGGVVLYYVTERLLSAAGI